MDKLKQIETFVAVLQKGSLTAAARAEGVAPAVISRRLDALEDRLGVRLLIRTTRRIVPTTEGLSFFEDCQRLLREWEEAEAEVVQGSGKVRGHLRITAPAGFGRRHVAPLLLDFLRARPEISATLDLSDRIVDLVAEGFDCAIRIGGLVDSSLVAIRLGQIRRVIVASPAYLAQHGVPRSLDDLAHHECLQLATQDGWDLYVNGKPVLFKPQGRFVCNDGAVLREWALAGMGLAWRSWWEVGEDLRWGRLVSVLPELAAPAVAISALLPQRRHLPLRVRLFVEHLRAHYARPDYWDHRE
ncbi:MAG: LysR family transcriptional regulator [Rhodocyclaceae bacterium]|nr:LysR family transcriptional regulator [Rhodocyclaceae bacterium]